jgi:hypothetical protein
MRRLSVLAAAVALLGGIQSARAEESYQSGHITNVSFAGDTTLVILDSGMPTNCAGTPFGWMMIQAAYKPIAAFVLGLRLTGNMSSVPVVVYTAGRDATGYCQVNQIDPAE